ncbi:AGAP010833-PA-like protein [Anopheles sinensis]|uniref:CLIP domain-containing serine protease n=1 Tax=Anopheles sinensis TaxID=74873 RepID=A0A084W667_ANOSI|nr:AGAP010833-PA-like protein [Anopheles sinensis]
MVYGWCYALLLVGFAVVLSARSVSQNNECLTPGGITGKCVLVRECEYIRNILRMQHHGLNDTEYVEKLKCGLTDNRLPLVCCPRITNDPLCGPISFPDRILGGNETSIDKFPWMVLLGFEARNSKIHTNCAGSLIGGPFVLTAAHCFAEAQKKRYKLAWVRVAEWNFRSHRGNKDCKKQPNSNSTICRRDYEVAGYSIHPAYKVNYAVHINDIAIIKLVTDVEFNEFVKPICLPLDDAQLPQPDGFPMDYVASGWGSTSTGSGMSYKLMTINLPWFDIERCKGLFPVPGGSSISEAHICAGGIRGQDTCHGDSGGPLMFEHAGATFLVGITSFGRPKCGKDGVPGVYTNVTHYLNWIQYEVFRGIIV